MIDRDKYPETTREFQRFFRNYKTELGGTHRLFMQDLPPDLRNSLRLFYFDSVGIWITSRRYVNRKIIFFVVQYSITKGNIVNTGTAGYEMRGEALHEAIEIAAKARESMIKIELGEK